MGNDAFIKLCKQLVTEYHNEHAEKKGQKQITADDVYIVWLSKVLQNNKALASTNVSDGMYYEITHDGDKGRIYLDAYGKQENRLIVI